jgi:hypothetical protein
VEDIKTDGGWMMDTDGDVDGTFDQENHHRNTS